MNVKNTIHKNYTSFIDADENDESKVSVYPLRVR